MRSSAPPLPDACSTCADERQYLPHRYAITADPDLGIGQTMQVIDTGEGVLLWDAVGYIDAEMVARVRDLGPVLHLGPGHCFGTDDDVA